MTLSKVTLLIAGVIIAMTSIAFFSNTYSKPWETTDYMLGFISPLFGSGLVLIVSCQIILGRKRRMRPTRQIQAS